VGKAVALSLSKECQLSELSLHELRQIDPIFEDDVYDFLGVENSIKKFCSYGSTGSDCVSEQINFWCHKLNLNKSENS
jgi:argininosuccinate lyase